MDSVNHALYTLHDRLLGLPAFLRTSTVLLLIHSLCEALCISPFFHALYSFHGNPKGLSAGTHSILLYLVGSGEDTGKGEDTGSAILSMCFLIRNGFRTQIWGKYLITWQSDTSHWTILSLLLINSCNTKEQESKDGMYFELQGEMNLKLEAQKIKDFTGGYEEWPKWKSRTECAFSESRYERILDDSEYATNNVRLNKVDSRWGHLYKGEQIFSFHGRYTETPQGRRALLDGCKRVRKDSCRKI